MGNASENRSWHSIRDLLGDFRDAPIALIGAPLGKGSITPGRCDLGPAVLRDTLPRISVYDLETQTDLAAMEVFDAGDLDLTKAMPADAFVPIRDAVRNESAKRGLTILAGGNNAITRGMVHGAGETLENTGLLTLDAHFDLRDTDLGLNNGNPVQALLDDGMPGENITQIGLAPFANTKKAHDKAKRAGISVHTLADVRANGLLAIVTRELTRLAARTERIAIDFDIDVIDRAQMPAAPGARPGGIAAQDFFAAARSIAAHPKVCAVDLAEFDPSLDVNNTGALTAARWFAEILAGFAAR